MRYTVGETYAFLQLQFTTPGNKTFLGHKFVKPIPGVDSIDKISVRLFTCTEHHLVASGVGGRALSTYNGFSFVEQTSGTKASPSSSHVWTNQYPVPIRAEDYSIVGDYTLKTFVFGTLFTLYDSCKYLSELWATVLNQDSPKSSIQSALKLYAEVLAEVQTATGRKVVLSTAHPSDPDRKKFPVGIYHYLSV